MTPSSFFRTVNEYVVNEAKHQAYPAASSNKAHWDEEKWLAAR